MDEYQKDHLAPSSLGANPIWPVQLIVGCAGLTGVPAPEVATNWK